MKKQIISAGLVCVGLLVSGVAVAAANPACAQARNWSQNYGTQSFSQYQGNIFGLWTSSNQTTPYNYYCPDSSVTIYFLNESYGAMDAVTQSATLSGYQLCTENSADLCAQNFANQNKIPYSNDICAHESNWSGSGLQYYCNNGTVAMSCFAVAQGDSMNIQNTNNTMGTGYQYSISANNCRNAYIEAGGQRFFTQSY
ncbi:MAG: hypothetical protein NTZ67_07060 [Gammaproteobacteria bacterium]|nr:hypothetical protein [Gammaproteobacteria bacterium]